MAKVLISFSLLVVLLAGIWFTVRPSVQAQDSSTSIEFVVTASALDVSQGRCSIATDLLTRSSRTQQVVVENEHHEIIAVLDLEGEAFSGRYCRVAQEVSVPDAKFYTIYIDDIRVTTLSKDTVINSDIGTLEIHIDTN